MAINAAEVPVYAGSVFEKVSQIMLGAVIDGQTFERIKRKDPPTPKKFQAVLAVLLDRIYRDPDTGLPNYESFRESLEQLIEQREAKKAHKDINRADGIGKRAVEPKIVPKDTVLFFDMNYMKNFNSSIGMQKTDRLIAAVAEIIHDSFRQESDQIFKEKREGDRKFNADVVARAKKGGDEFIVLMRGCSRDDARKKADMLFNKIKSKVFYIPDDNLRGHKHTVINNLSLSYGYYELDSKLNPSQEETHDTAETALAKAEELMKQRKQSWKNDGRINEPRIQKLSVNAALALTNVAPPGMVIRLPLQARVSTR